jgi:hypothetical protein
MAFAMIGKARNPIASPELSERQTERGRPAQLWAGEKGRQPVAASICQFCKQIRVIPPLLIR